ncbi:hypothetical protein G5B30_14830 [Sphingobacterium sp. SGG-5]|uniref:hypothetical protein n=1 Tax=Sphingobacterium sp. SGG-5 TaxID=2710881 RepID=UPI0013EC790C|nr:hypothetical protein [Sphingobacterium sp. SGG-5]NGM63182.1 hypothetical protein [Sphingobacterium sp. SGG-5]
MDTQMQEYQLYYKAVANPLEVDDMQLLRLIDKYPYSQPLRYALLRKKMLLTQEYAGLESTLLYAPDAGWLWQYAHTPVEHIEELETVSEDYVPFEELQKETEAPVADDEIEKLAYEGSMGDYFVFEQKEKETLEEASIEADSEGGDALVDEENISLYNDELMPYSFRWWLHKTRLEHADTYQPFATPVLPQPQKGQFDPQKLDEAILDQQIKENIIRFQDPELKLSDAAKKQSEEITEPQKGNEIIDKFIREEPVIHPPSPEQLNTENMARRSAEDNYMLVTETLANIYVDQGLYLKGIEVFKKLILKYPEKKSYFAARIQELERNL